MKVQALEYIGKGIRDIAESRKLDGDALVNTARQISYAALWPAGSWATDKIVDNTMQNYSPEMQYAAKVAGAAAFSAPLLTNKPFGKFEEGLLGKTIEYSKGEPADFTMNALTLGIGGIGMFLKDVGRAKPKTPRPDDTQEQRAKDAANPYIFEEHKKSSENFLTSAAMLGGIFALAKGIEESISSYVEDNIDDLKGLVDTLTDKEKTTFTVNGETGVEAEALKEGDIITLSGEKAIIPADSTILEATGRDGKTLKEGADALLLDETGLMGESKGKFVAKVGEEGRAMQGMRLGDYVKDIKIQLTKTVEESDLFAVVQRQTDETIGKRAGKIDEFIAKKYIPFLIGAVALQMGWAYHHDRVKHVERIADKRNDLRETIANSESDNQVIADQTAALTQYTEDHGKKHSAQFGLKRAAELAIKGAPCAVVAALLYGSFTKVALRGKGLGLFNEDALKTFERVTREEGSIAATDFNGVLTKGDLPGTSSIYKVAGETLSEIRQGVTQGWQKTFEHVYNHSYGAQLASGNRTSRNMLEHMKQAAKGIESAGAKKGEALQGGFAIDEAFSHGKGFEVTPDLKDGVQRKFGNVTVTSGNRETLRKLGIELPEALIQNAETKPGVKHIYTHIHNPEAGKSGETFWKVTQMKRGELREGTIDSITKLIKNKSYVPIISGSQAADVAAQVEEIKIGLRKAHISEADISKYLIEEYGVVPTEKAKKLQSIVERIAKEEGKAVKDIPVSMTVDGINDTEMMALVQGDEPVLTGAIAAVEDTAHMRVQRGADALIRDINDIHTLGDLAQPFKNITNGLVIGAAAWMAGLVGHHALASAGVTDREKQPSTVMASVLHEAPTVLISLAAAGFAGYSANKFGKSFANKVTETAETVAARA